MTICLNAESLHAEVHDGPYSEQVKQAVLNATPEQVAAAITAAVDDTWWEVYDRTRSAAIQQLAQEAGVPYEFG